MLLHCIKSMLEHSHKIQKGCMKNSPYQQYNDHKPNMNLHLFLLTQPICITLRFFTASSAQYCFSCKTWRNPVTENWGDRIIYRTCTRAFEGRRMSHLLWCCHLYTCHQGVWSCPLHVHCRVRRLLCGACNCLASLLKLSCQREGLIFHWISAATLSSSIPYVGWIKCTMNLYSKWTGK